MPLQEMTIVDVREQMALRALNERYTLTEVADMFGVLRGRQSGYGAIDTAREVVPAWRIVLMRRTRVRIGRAKRLKD